jgi:hypothetical protein
MRGRWGGLCRRALSPRLRCTGLPHALRVRPPAAIATTTAAAVATAAVAIAATAPAALTTSPAAATRAAPAMLRVELLALHEHAQVLSNGQPLHRWSVQWI